MRVPLFMIAFQGLLFAFIFISLTPEPVTAPSPPSPPTTTPAPPSPPGESCSGSGINYDCVSHWCGGSYCCNDLGADLQCSSCNTSGICLEIQTSPEMNAITIGFEDENLFEKVDAVTNVCDGIPGMFKPKIFGAMAALSSLPCIQGVSAGSSVVPTTALACKSGHFLYGSVSTTADADPQCWPDVVYLANGESIGAAVTAPTPGGATFVTIVHALTTTTLTHTGLGLSDARLTCATGSAYNQYGVVTQITYWTYLPHQAGQYVETYSEITVVCAARSPTGTTLWTPSQFNYYFNRIAHTYVADATGTLGLYGVALSAGDSVTFTTLSTYDVANGLVTTPLGAAKAASYFMVQYGVNDTAEPLPDGLRFECDGKSHGFQSKIQQYPNRGLMSFIPGLLSYSASSYCTITFAKAWTKNFFLMFGVRGYDHTGASITTGLLQSPLVTVPTTFVNGELLPTTIPIPTAQCSTPPVSGWTNEANLDFMDFGTNGVSFADNCYAKGFYGACGARGLRSGYVDDQDADLTFNHALFEVPVVCGWDMGIFKNSHTDSNHHLDYISAYLPHSHVKLGTAQTYDQQAAVTTDNVWQNLIEVYDVKDPPNNVFALPADTWTGSPLNLKFAAQGAIRVNRYMALHIHTVLPPIEVTNGQESTVYTSPPAQLAVPHVTAYIPAGSTGLFVTLSDTVLSPAEISYIVLGSIFLASLVVHLTTLCLARKGEYPA